jgi:hypothetical protein
MSMVKKLKRARREAGVKKSEKRRNRAEDRRSRLFLGVRHCVTLSNPERTALRREKRGRHGYSASRIALGVFTPMSGVFVFVMGEPFPNVGEFVIAPMLVVPNPGVFVIAPMLFVPAPGVFVLAPMSPCIGVMLVCLGPWPAGHHSRIAVFGPMQCPRVPTDTVSPAPHAAQ